MADRRWKGKAKDVIQVDLITIALDWAQGDTITVTVDGIDFVVTIGTLVTPSQVATTLKQAFMGETLTDTAASCSPTIAQTGAQLIPQFAEVTASIVATAPTVVVLTCNTAGKPFEFTCAEVTATTGTAVLSSSVVPTGKNWGTNADNWEGDTLPVDGDNIIFDSGSTSLKWGLLPAIQPGSFTKTKGYSGTIGLPEVNIDNPNKPYPEYRTKAYTFDDNGGATCTYHFEQGTGSGSGLCRINAGAGLSIWNVYGYATRLVTGYPSLLLTGTNAANILNMQQGDVGVGYFGEASTVVNVGAGNGTTSGATLVCGTAVTLTSSTINIAGGVVSLHTATATSDIDIHSGGTLNLYGTGAHADIDVQNGTCNYLSSGILTTLAVRKGGKFTRAGDQRAATITNVVQLYPGSTFLDPNKSLTLTNGYKQNGGVNADYTINLGTDRTFTVA